MSGEVARALTGLMAALAEWASVRETAQEERLVAAFDAYLAAGGALLYETLEEPDDIPPCLLGDEPCTDPEHRPR
jgi:hypothetical protein